MPLCGFFRRGAFYYVLFSQHTVQELGVAAVEKVVGVVDIVAGHVYKAFFLEQSLLHVIKTCDGGAGTFHWL